MIRREDEEEADEDETTQDELGVKKHPQPELFDKFAVKSIDQVDLHDLKLLNPNVIKFTFDTSKGEWCEMEFEVICPAQPQLNIPVPFENGQDFNGERHRESLPSLRHSRDPWNLALRQGAKFREIGSNGNVPLLECFSKSKAFGGRRPKSYRSVGPR